jgi:hypothetical protein
MNTLTFVVEIPPPAPQKRKLLSLLESDPCFQTRCRDCGNGAAGDDSCRVHASAGEREFRFRNADARSYCLLWYPSGEGDSGTAV